MPIWARSVFRAVALLLVAYVAIAWAAEAQPGIWGWGLLLGGLVAYLAYRLTRVLRGRRARREARWERAIYDDGARPRALREVRRARAKLGGGSQPRHLDEYVRLSLTLAELLDADENYDEAVQVVEGIPVERLSTLDEGLVRHTHAVTLLRAGDARAAQQRLQSREPSGDRELDLRLDLLEAYARAELGDAEAVLSDIEEIERDPGVDESVVTEARVVMAAALDVLGRHEEALVVLTPVGRNALESVAHLGLPRVREMAREVLRSTSSRPPAY